MSSSRPVGKALAKVALLGFALSPVVTRTARAGYYAAGWLTLSGITTSAALTTAGLVILILKATGNTADASTAPDTTLARRLIDSALITMHGDLAMQLSLLQESPTAFHQLSRELEVGGGPSVDALARATGLPVGTLQARWTAANAEVDTVEDQSRATRVVAKFLQGLSPDLSVDRDMAADLAWNLARERAAPDFPAGARAHGWLAEWLGVPVEAVGAATERAVAGLPADEATLRTRVHADPDLILNPVAATIQAEHVPALVARVAALEEEARRTLPPEVAADVIGRR